MTHVLQTAAVSIGNVESVMLVNIDISTNITLSTLLIRAIYRTCVIWTSTSLTCGLVVRASECGIWRSEARSLIGTQNFFFVPRSWQDEKTSFSNIYKLSGIYLHICLIKTVLMLVNDWFDNFVPCSGFIIFWEMTFFYGIMYSSSSPSSFSVCNCVIRFIASKYCNNLNVQILKSSIDIVLDFQIAAFRSSSVAYFIFFFFYYYFIVFSDCNFVSIHIQLYYIWLCVKIGRLPGDSNSRLSVKAERTRSLF